MTTATDETSITLKKSELKTLIYEIMDQRKANQNGAATTFPRLTKTEYETIIQDAVGKDKSKNRRYSYERYDRRMDLLERVIRLEEGQHRIEDNMDTRFDSTQTQINVRFDNVNSRFDDVNNRLNDMNKRFEDMNKRFGDMNKRFEDINKRFNMFFWIVTSGFTLLSLLIVLLKLFS